MKNIELYKRYCNHSFLNLQCTDEKLTTSSQKQQFYITHTIHPTVFPTFLYIWVKNTPPVKMLNPQKIASSYIFIKTQYA